MNEIQEFLGVKLPIHIQNELEGKNVHIKAGQEQIRNTIAFTRPFMKIEKIVILKDSDDIVGTYSIGSGRVTMDDMEGHYNNTIFLAFCGRLMGQSASTHLALLFPETAPQIVKVERIKPIINADDNLWKPNKNGSIFLVETDVLRKKAHIIQVDSKISFGELIFGIAYNATIVLMPKDTIRDAKELPR